MIAIVNVGPYDDPDPTGWRDYEVRINYVICTFRHKRGDGLAVCLAKAAKAVCLAKATKAMMIRGEGE